MWSLRWLLCGLLCGLLCASAHARGTRCYWNSQDAYRYFSTVTPYDDVRGDIRDEPALPGCQPSSLWMLMRHGTRHPTEAAAALMKEAAALQDQIISSYRAGRGEMCAQDIQDLANWTWDIALENEPAYLTEEGWYELEQLGARVAVRFGGVLGALGAGAGAARFRPTDTQRTRQSARAFLRGLANDTFTLEKPLDRDETIRYKFCDKYNQEVEEDTRFDEEEKKFRQTDDYQQMLWSTRRRLGLPRLSAAQAQGLYELCRHLRAYALARRHAWCAVFRQQDLPALEYLQDLGDHFQRGYGSLSAAQLGGLTLKHLLASLLEGAGGARRVEGYFTHDTMLQMVLTALGLFRDYPPVSGLSADPARKWRTSLMTPFAANILVVVNTCKVKETSGRTDAITASVVGEPALFEPGHTAPGHAGHAGHVGHTAPEHTGHVLEQRVQVFVNERAVPLCGARACAWSELREILLPFQNTTMDFCQLSTSTPLH